MRQSKEAAEVVQDEVAPDDHLGDRAVVGRGEELLHLVREEGRAGEEGEENCRAKPNRRHGHAEESQKGKHAIMLGTAPRRCQASIPPEMV